MLAHDGIESLNQKLSRFLVVDCATKRNRTVGAHGTRGEVDEPAHARIIFRCGIPMQLSLWRGVFRGSHT